MTGKKLLSALFVFALAMLAVVATAVLLPDGW